MAFVLAVDYDGTIVEGSYPEVGAFKQDVIAKVKEFMANVHCEVVLWTCREGSALEEATKRCEEAGLKFDAINANAPTANAWIANEVKTTGDSFAGRKIYADFYADDKAMNLDIFNGIDVDKTCNNFAEREN